MSWTDSREKEQCRGTTTEPSWYELVYSVQCVVESTSTQRSLTWLVSKVVNLGSLFGFDSASLITADAACCRAVVDGRPTGREAATGEV